ncbi:hypothetical protein M231_00039 [Tremella mesenterica]|uniref:Uncharacterized protein n=1 Tax=Tremella mesenterica TaxID=5217 RepID=A0A4Q1BWE3_TREME|nr:hypothetical protein M231_00039 [Tremella mesenterica]
MSGLGLGQIDQPRIGSHIITSLPPRPRPSAIHRSTTTLADRISHADPYPKTFEAPPALRIQGGGPKPNLLSRISSSTSSKDITTEDRRYRSTISPHIPPSPSSSGELRIEDRHYRPILTPSPPLLSGEMRIEDRHYRPVRTPSPPPSLMRRRTSSPPRQPRAERLGNISSYRDAQSPPRRRLTTYEQDLRYQRGSIYEHQSRRSPPYDPTSPQRRPVYDHIPRKPRPQHHLSRYDEEEEEEWRKYNNRRRSPEDRPWASRQVGTDRYRPIDLEERDIRNYEPVTRPAQKTSLNRDLQAEHNGARMNVEGENTDAHMGKSEEQNMIRPPTPEGPPLKDDSEGGSCWNQNPSKDLSTTSSTSVNQPLGKHEVEVDKEDQADLLILDISDPADPSNTLQTPDRAVFLDNTDLLVQEELAEPTVPLEPPAAHEDHLNSKVDVSQSDQLHQEGYQEVRESSPQLAQGELVKQAGGQEEEEEVAESITSEDLWGEREADRSISPIEDGVSNEVQVDEHGEDVEERTRDEEGSREAEEREVDEKLDLGISSSEPDLDGERMDGGERTGGVLVMVKADLPPELWSEDIDIRTRARAEFNEQTVARLGQEGKSAQTILWLDDSVIWPWVLASSVSCRDSSTQESATSPCPEEQVEHEGSSSNRDPTPIITSFERETPAQTLEVAQQDDRPSPTSLSKQPQGQLQDGPEYTESTLDWKDFEYLISYIHLPSQLRTYRNRGPDKVGLAAFKRQHLAKALVPDVNGKPTRQARLYMGHFGRMIIYWSPLDNSQLPTNPFPGTIQMTVDGASPSVSSSPSSFASVPENTSDFDVNTKATSISSSSTLYHPDTSSWRQSPSSTSESSVSTDKPVKKSESTKEVAPAKRKRHTRETEINPDKLRIADLPNAIMILIPPNWSTPAQRRQPDFAAWAERQRREIMDPDGTGVPIRVAKCGKISRGKLQINWKDLEGDPSVSRDQSQRASTSRSNSKIQSPRDTQSAQQSQVQNPRPSSQRQTQLSKIRIPKLNSGKETKKDQEITPSDKSPFTPLSSHSRRRASSESSSSFPLANVDKVKKRKVSQARHTLPEIISVSPIVPLSPVATLEPLSATSHMELGVGQITPIDARSSASMSGTSGVQISSTVVDRNVSKEPADSMGESSFTNDPIHSNPPDSSTKVDRPSTERSISYTPLSHSGIERATSSGSTGGSSIRNSQSNPLKDLEDRLEGSFNSLEKWLVIHDEHPARRSTVNKQIKRYEDEIFELREEIRILREGMDVI